MDVAAVGFATIKLVSRQTVSSLHPNTGLENIPILYSHLWAGSAVGYGLDGPGI